MPNINVKVAAHVFEPACYSREELDFLLANMEKPPIVALSKPMPAHVNKGTVKPLLEELYDLQQLKTHERREWGFPITDAESEDDAVHGYEAIKDSIVRYLAWMERVDLIRDRTERAIGNPSMFAWDSTGGAFKYGIDSDAGIVRTEILPDGSRRAFGVKLVDRGRRSLKSLGDVAPWVSRSKAEVLKDSVVIDVDPKKSHGTLTCSICGKAESFPVQNRSLQNLARSRMSKHLKTEKVEAARHRLLHRKTFEAPTART